MRTTDAPITIKRHQTALNRLKVSRPIRLALEAGLIDKDTSVFDYGCGRGDDLRGLRAQGIPCFGWDPVYRPDGERRHADVVNLGYVVNVIEDPKERVQVLHEAWRFTQKMLIVAARLSLEVKETDHQRYNDGFLTKRGTFQKFFSQYELRDWIDKALGVQSVAAGPGIFFVFRDDNLRQSYLAARYRRKSSIPLQRQSDILFSRHKELLQPLMNFVASRGRLPDNELQEEVAIREVFGTLRAAFNVVQRVTGKEQWEKIREERSQDLVVYLALERFGGRPRFSALSGDLQRDVKAFFGTYTHACALADHLLFSAGKMEAVDTACQDAPCGKLTHEALYVHISGLPHLPPLLRVYEGCARAYIGAVEGANIIKLHRRIPQVSYLAYPDFEHNPHPALLGSLLVQLQNFKVHYRDYSDSNNPPILHRKEEFVPKDFPLRPKFERLTHQEERWGLYENPTSIGTRERWRKLLEEKGVCLYGHRLLRASR